MKKATTILCAAACMAILAHASAEAPAQTQQPKEAQASPFKAFTARIVGKNVRLRSLADVDSAIVKELKKDELIVVVGEEADFYTVRPTQDIKAYVFRSFILDGSVEGNRVNVRLSPNLEAPIIGHFNTGDKIEGVISKENNKWLEIAPPETTKFYVAKEFCKYVGGPEVKGIYDKKKFTLSQLMQTTELLTKSEMNKPFDEINIERIEGNYNTVLSDYQEFTEQVDRAKQLLIQVKEQYLQKKLAYLEDKAAQLNQEATATLASTSYEAAHSSIEVAKEAASSTNDRMKVWENVEQALYLAWASSHHNKTMGDFYQEDQAQATMISGILDAYLVPVKNRPGDYILKDKDLPVAYVYSTQVDLQKYVGKKVNLVATKRSNNNFAFDAYYVHNVE